MGYPETEEKQVQDGTDTSTKSGDDDTLPPMEDSAAAVRSSCSPINLTLVGDDNYPSDDDPRSRPPSPLLPFPSPSRHASINAFWILRERSVAPDVIIGFFTAVVAASIVMALLEIDALEEIKKALGSWLTDLCKGENASHQMNMVEKTAVFVGAFGVVGAIAGGCANRVMDRKWC